MQREPRVPLVRSPRIVLTSELKVTTRERTSVKSQADRRSSLNHTLSGSCKQVKKLCDRSSYSRLFSLFFSFFLLFFFLFFFFVSASENRRWKLKLERIRNSTAAVRQNWSTVPIPLRWTFIRDPGVREKYCTARQQLGLVNELPATRVGAIVHALTTVDVRFQSTKVATNDARTYVHNFASDGTTKHSLPTVLRETEWNTLPLKRPHVPMHFEIRIVFWKYRSSLTRFPVARARTHGLYCTEGSDRFRSKSRRNPPWHRSVDLNGSTFAADNELSNAFDDDNTRG